MMLCRHEEEWRCYYDRLATAGDGKRTGVRSRGEGFSWQASPQQRRRLTLPGQAQACGRLAGMPPKSRHYQEQRDFFEQTGVWLSSSNLFRRKTRPPRQREAQAKAQAEAKATA